MDGTPKKVRDEAAEADKLIEEMKHGKKTDEGKPPEEPAEAGQPEPEPTKAPEPAPTEDAVKLKDELGAKTHAYDVLKGKYDKEVPRLYEEVGALKQQIAELVEAQKEPTPEPGPEPDAEAIQKFVEEYGPEHKAGIEAIVKKAMASTIKPIETSVADISSKVASVSESQSLTSEEIFYVALNADYPEWGEINKTRDFVGWLRLEKDPETDLTYQEMLDNAASSFDAAAAIEIFKKYKALGKPDKPDEPKPDPLEAHAEPVTSGGGGEESPNNPLIPRSEINAFYETSNYNGPKWEGREDERDKLEKKYEDAIKDGRVTD